MPSDCGTKTPSALARDVGGAGANFDAVDFQHGPAEPPWPRPPPEPPPRSAGEVPLMDAVNENAGQAGSSCLVLLTYLKGQPYVLLGAGLRLPGELEPSTRSRDDLCGIAAEWAQRLLSLEKRPVTMLAAQL